MRRLALMALLVATPAFGQTETVINPTTIEFTLSPDHASGMRYEIGWFLQDAASPAQTAMISASATASLGPGATYSQPLERPVSIPFGAWICRVRALAADGQQSAWSAPSNPFSYSPPPPVAPRPPGAPILRAPPGSSGGSGSLTVAIDDEGPVWWQGALIGTVLRWDRPIAVSLTLWAGGVLAISGVNTGGPGGAAYDLLYEGRRYASAASSCRVLPVADDGTGQPAGWTAPTFDDAAWAQATAWGPPTNYPWGQFDPPWPAGSPAVWVWDADQTRKRVLVRCRIGA